MIREQKQSLESNLRYVQEQIMSTQKDIMDVDNANEVGIFIFIRA